MNATLENTTEVSTKPNFGNGRYSAEMQRIYDACQSIFGIEPAKAEKIAKQAGSDAGAAFRNVSATMKIGKAGENGKVTIADASKAKGVTMTNPLAVVRAIQWAGDAGKNEVSFGKTKWVLREDLQKWVDTLSVKE